MKKILGMAEMLMLALTFFLAITAAYLAHQFDLETKETQEQYVDRLVTTEALMIENYARAVQDWFNLKGKGILYACEDTNPGCRLNTYVNILPTYSNQLMNDSFIPNNAQAQTIGSDPAISALHASVIKRTDVPSGYDYEIVLTLANLQD